MFFERGRTTAVARRELLRRRLVFSPPGSLFLRLEFHAHNCNKVLGERACGRSRACERTAVDALSSFSTARRPRIAMLAHRRPPLFSRLRPACTAPHQSHKVERETQLRTRLVRFIDPATCFLRSFAGSTLRARAPSLACVCAEGGRLSPLNSRALPASVPPRLTGAARGTNRTGCVARAP